MRRVVSRYKVVNDGDVGNWTIRWGTGGVGTVRKVDTAVKVRAGERSV